MKRIFLALALFLGLISISYSQSESKVRFGVKAGLSTGDVTPKMLLEDVENFGLTLKDANYGLHFGVFLRFGEKIFFQPEVLLNSTKFKYDFEDIGSGEIFQKEEKFTNLDIPLLMGLKFGPLRIQGGPVGYVYLANDSDLTDIDGFTHEKNDFTLGWQGGFGLDIWKVNLDFRWQGNFNELGDHLRFAGEEINFDQRPGRFVASVGFLF